MEVCEGCRGTGKDSTGIYSCGRCKVDPLLAAILSIHAEYISQLMPEEMPDGQLTNRPPGITLH